LRNVVTSTSPTNGQASNSGGSPLFLQNLYKSQCKASSASRLSARPVAK
jgi:hypothetical protein